MKLQWFKEGYCHRDYGPGLRFRSPAYKEDYIFYRKDHVYREDGIAEQERTPNNSWLVLYNRDFLRNKFHLKLNNLLRARLQ
jgi:hypothetical protein